MPHPTRSPLSLRAHLRRAAVVGAGAVLLVTGCSSGPDFCDTAATFRSTVDATGDQTMEQAATSWTEAGTSMSSTSAPEEIAEDWTVVTDTVVDVGDLFTNGSDVQKASDAQTLLLSQEFQDAQRGVLAYLEQSCPS